MSTLVTYAGEDEFCYGSEKDVWYQLLLFRSRFFMMYGVKWQVYSYGIPAPCVSYSFKADSGFLDFTHDSDQLRVRRVQAIYDYDLDQYTLIFSIYRKRLGGYWKWRQMSYGTYQEGYSSEIATDIFKRSKKYTQFRNMIIKWLRPEYSWNYNLTI